MDSITQRLIDRFGEKLAILAAKSDLKSTKHAAVLLTKTLDPIVFGYNRNYKHAEIDVLDKWEKAFRPRGWKPYLIFVIRIRGKGIKPGFNFSKPCKVCEAALVDHGLRYLHT